MKRYEIKIKQTSELTPDELKAIIRLKQQHWNYDDASQLAWFQKNVTEEDIHLLVLEGQALIAYLDAVWVDVKLNGNPMRALGVGNVCVAKSHTNSGVGAMLIAALNFRLKSDDICGFLLCKDPLVGFYQKSNWKLLNAANITVAGAAFSHNAMGYHLPRNFDKIDKIEFSREF